LEISKNAHKLMKILRESPVHQKLQPENLYAHALNQFPRSNEIFLCM